MTALATPPKEDPEASLAPLRSEYPFDSHFLDLPGARLHYVDEGPRRNEAVLFLHGNPTWSFAWRHAIRALSPVHRCVAPDHVGCGLSSKREDYPHHLAQHVANIEALVAHLGLERLTLVLHDWGGAIGMGFARRHPEQVARLVFLNTAAFPSERMPFRIALCRVPVFGRLAVRRLNAFARAATYMAVERPLTSLAKRGYLLPYRDFASRVGVSAFVEDIPMTPDHPSRHELEAIAAALPSFRDRPALVLWGLRDWCFTPAFLDEWRRILPDAQVRTFMDAGHYLFEDEREAVVLELERFLTPTEG